MERDAERRAQRDLPRDVRDCEAEGEGAEADPGDGSEQAAGLEVLATLCGWALARGHARSGRRIAVASYLGMSDRFDQGIAGFAQSYADQAEKDHASLLKAIKQGKIPVETGV